jgi:hypothetical protein
MTRRSTRNGSRSVRLAAVCGMVIPLLLLAQAGHAFVGAIAVGLGRMQDMGEVETSFEADATIETEETTLQSHINYKPGKVRDAVKVGGREMVTIRRFDLDKVWMIMGPGMVMEIDPEQGSDQAPDYKLVSREKVGPDTVNGMATTKYKSVYETSDGKFGGFTWYTDDNIAVKGFLVHQSKGEKVRLKFELRNLERSDQPDSIFEPPAGAHKLDLRGIPGIPNMGGGGR